MNESGWFDEEAIQAERWDADLEQASFEREGRAIDAARRRGICCHGSCVGRSATGEAFYSEQEGLVGTQMRCTEGCGRVFEDYDDWVAAMQQARNGR